MALGDWRKEARGEDRDRDGRIRPGRPRGQQRSGLRALSGTTTRLLRLARATSRPPSGGRSGARQRPRWTDSVRQRGTVTVRYAKSGVRGGWRAHGRYVERESAAGDHGEHPSDRVGQSKEQRMDETLGGWQDGGDERLWKIIVSPEHGDEVDFDVLAEDLIEHLEEDVDSKLEWTGVVHRNTEHPHLHLAVRGVRDDGRPLTFSRQQIRHGMRDHVRTELTRQLGPRTLREILAAQHRETENEQVTQIDRELSTRLEKGSTEEFQRLEPQSWLERKRLLTLEKLKLAKQEDGQWEIRTDFIKQLNTLRDLRERGRSLFRSGVAVSDDKLPTEVLLKSRRFVGRVLLNNEEETSGRMQTAFETLDGKLAFVRHDAAMRNAWLRGDLKPGNLVLVDSVQDNPDRLYAVALGADADLLKDPGLLGKTIDRLRRRGLMPTDPPTQSGWIGQFFRGVESFDRQRGISL